MSILVLREDKDGIATLTLNRPDKCNALTGDVFAALEEHVKDIGHYHKEIGLVILRGAGGNFSAGDDLAEVAHALKAHAKPHYEFEVIEQLANLPQPVIAAVQGRCSTGALELALAADLVVASESAQFSDDYARWGLSPVWGLSLRLPLRVGTAKAREMFFTSRAYDGRQAAHIHLANYCFPDDQFESELARLAGDILANSWYSNLVSKRVLIETDGLTLKEAHGLEIFKNEGVAPDAQARVAEFFKRH